MRFKCVWVQSLNFKPSRERNERLRGGHDRLWVDRWDVFTPLAMIKPCQPEEWLK